MAELEAIVRAHLEGLDDDILEYVLSMIGEGGLDDEDMREQVGMFLISAEYCADEDAAAETLKALAAKLHAGGAAPPAQDSQVRSFTACVHVSHDVCHGLVAMCVDSLNISLPRLNRCYV
jgi:hypothetical protein